MELLFFPAALAVFPAMAEPKAPPPPAGSDEALMLSYARGDAQAFETLYTRHKGGVYRYFVRSLRGESGVADELFQDVWANLIKARATYKVEAKFTTWLYRLAHNRLIDHYRRAQLVQFVPVDGDSEEAEPQDWPASQAPGPEVQVASRQAAAQLKRLVEALPPAQREAFLLQAEGGLSLEAIAEATGSGRETVKSRLRYAFDKLRTGMKDYL